MSTRLYVAVVTTSVLAVALLLLSFATYVVLAYSMHAQLDRGLAAEGRQLSDYFLTSTDSPLLTNTQPVSTTPYEAVAPSGTIFRLVGANGRVLAQSIGSFFDPLHQSAYGTSGARPQRLSFETVGNADSRYRVYSLPVLLPAQTEGILQLARPLAPVEQTLAHLRIVLISGTGVSLLFAVGLGLLLAHIAAKPIEDVASATARIRAFGEEDERLAPPGRLQEPTWLAQSLNNLLDRVEVAEAAAGRTAEFRAQCAAYVQSQLERLIVQQRSLNDFLRTELRPHDPGTLELPPGQRRSVRAFLQTDPQRWVTAYDDVVVWLESQTEALARWTNNLPLSLGTQEVLDLESDMVSLAPLLYGLCQEKREEYGDSVQITCHLPCTPRLRVDRRSLYDALAALIDDARSRTPAGGDLTVALQSTEESATITVTSSGAGIAPDELPHVFTGPTRAATSGESPDPGLPFAHDVVVQLGGTLSVASAEGAGNTFTVRLPLEGSRGV